MQARYMLKITALIIAAAFSSQCASDAKKTERKSPQAADQQQQQPPPESQPIAPAADSTLPSGFRLGLPANCQELELGAELFCFSCPINNLPIERCVERSANFSPTQHCRHQGNTLIECQSGNATKTFDLRNPIESQMLTALPVLLPIVKSVVNAQLSSDRAKEKAIVGRAIDFVNQKRRAIVLGEDNAALASQLAALVKEEHASLSGDEAENSLTDEEVATIEESARTALDALQQQKRMGSLRIMDTLPAILTILAANPSADIGEILSNLNFGGFDIGGLLDSLLGNNQEPDND